MNYVIVANGKFLPIRLIRKIIKNKIIVACDGALDKLLKHKIIPTVVIGDFDSTNLRHACAGTAFPSILKSKNPNIKIIEAKNQNQTDLQKAILYCDKQKAKSIEIICALHHRMDHELMNLRILKMYYKKTRPLVLHAETQTLQYAENETVIITGKPGDYCGIFAFPKATFTSNGLKYEGKNYPLEFAKSESVSNELLKNTAKITIKGSALLIS